MSSSRQGTKGHAREGKIYEGTIYKKILYPHFTKFKLQPQDKNLSLTDIEEKLINNVDND